LKLQQSLEEQRKSHETKLAETDAQWRRALEQRAATEKSLRSENESAQKQLLSLSTQLRQRTSELNDATRTVATVSKTSDTDALEHSSFLQSLTQRMTALLGNSASLAPTRSGTDKQTFERLFSRYIELNEQRRLELDRTRREFELREAEWRAQLKLLKEQRNSPPSPSPSPFNENGGASLMTQLHERQSLQIKELQQQVESLLKQSQPSSSPVDVKQYAKMQHDFDAANQSAEQLQTTLAQVEQQRARLEHQVMDLQRSNQELFASNSRLEEFVTEQQNAQLLLSSPDSSMTKRTSVSWKYQRRTFYKESMTSFDWLFFYLPIIGILFD
jgi:hypothetical protein